MNSPLGIRKIRLRGFRIAELRRGFPHGIVMPGSEPFAVEAPFGDA
jgi:hypothetical protein